MKNLNVFLEQAAKIYAMDVVNEPQEHGDAVKAVAEDFKAGADWIHAELTRWHAPKKEEFPKELEWKPIQLKLTQPFSKDSTIRGGFFGAGDFVVHGDYWPERQILGWRYIPE